MNGPEFVGHSSIMSEILVIHREGPGSSAIVRMLDGHEEWRPTLATSAKQAEAILSRQSYTLVIVELTLAKSGSRPLLDQLLDDCKQHPVLLTGGDGTVNQVVEALNRGAAGFVHQAHIQRDLVEQVTRVLSAANQNKSQARLLECMTSARSMYSIESDPALIPTMLARFQASVRMFRITDEAECTRLAIALEEALTNALYHGNLEVSSKLRQDSLTEYYALAKRRRQESPYAERRIHVIEELDQEKAVFTIRDEGPGFDTTNINAEPDPEDLEAVSGRGILLMQAFMDEVVYNDRGNEVKLVKLTPKADDATRVA